MVPDRVALAVPSNRPKAPMQTASKAASAAPVVSIGLGARRPAVSRAGLRSAVAARVAGKAAAKVAGKAAPATRCLEIPSWPT